LKIIKNPMYLLKKFCEFSPCSYFAVFENKLYKGSISSTLYKQHLVQIPKAQKDRSSLWDPRTQKLRVKHWWNAHLVSKLENRRLESQLDLLGIHYYCHLLRILIRFKNILLFNKLSNALDILQFWKASKKINTCRVLLIDCIELQS